jgi:hypothetical protein
MGRPKQGWIDAVLYVQNERAEVGVCEVVHRTFNAAERCINLDIREFKRDESLSEDVPDAFFVLSYPDMKIEKVWYGEEVKRGGEEA